MKKMNLMRSFATLMLAATALCACSDNDNKGNGPVEGGLESLKAQTIVIGGNKSAVGSAVAAPFSGMVYVAATSESGLSTYDEISETGKYIYVLVSPSLIGKEFDLMTELSSFTVMAVWGTDIYVAAAQETSSEDSGIVEGKCLVKNDGNKYEAFVTMKTVEGVEISMRAAAVAEEEVNNNTISYDEVSKPIRASFYMVEEELAEDEVTVVSRAHFLYFTPSGVDYFDEMMEMAKYYVYITLMNEELATGRTIDLEGNEDVMVGLVDYENTDEDGYESYFAVTEGSLKIKVTGEGEYEVFLDAKLDNQKNVSVEFTGACTPVDAVKEMSNSFEFNGNTVPINTVFIEKTSAQMWTLYFSGMSGATFEEAKEYSPLKMTLPPLGEEYEGYGFSVYDFMSIEYGPNVWSNAQGSVGTVQASLVGNVLKTEFTNYENLKGEYEGEVNIVE
ncbi:MAG: hypothetical protein J6K28_04980 [Alistipes sp.]|nr:hypothetical protein [Alistipes sp.]